MNREQANQKRPKTLERPQGRAKTANGELGMKRKEKGENEAEQEEGPLIEDADGM